MPTERRLNSVRPFATIASLALAIAKYSYNNNKRRGAGQDIYERNADRMWPAKFLVSTGRRGGSIIERRRRRRKTTRSHLHGGTTKVAEVKLTSRAQRAKIIDNYRRASSRAPTIYMYANPPQFTASLPRAVVRFFRRTGAASRSSFRGNDSIPILVSATIVPRNHPMIYGTVRRKPRTGCQQTKLIRIVASRPIMLDN